MKCPGMSIKTADILFMSITFLQQRGPDSNPSFRKCRCSNEVWWSKWTLFGSSRLHDGQFPFLFSCFTEYDRLLLYIRNTSQNIANRKPFRNSRRNCACYLTEEKKKKKHLLIGNNGDDLSTHMFLVASIHHNDKHETLHFGKRTSFNWTLHVLLLPGLSENRLLFRLLFLCILFFRIVFFD